MVSLIYLSSIFVRLRLCEIFYGFLFICGILQKGLALSGLEAALARVRVDSRQVLILLSMVSSLLSD